MPILIYKEEEKSLSSKCVSFTYLHFSATNGIHHSTCSAVNACLDMVKKPFLLSFILETNIHLTNYDILAFWAYPSMHSAEGRQWKSYHRRANTGRQSHWCSLSLVWISGCGGDTHEQRRPWWPDIGACIKCITSQAINSVSWCGCVSGGQWHLPLLLRGVEGPERTIPATKTTRRRTRKLCECCCIPILIICAVIGSESRAAVIWQSSVRLRDLTTGSRKRNKRLWLSVTSLIEWICGNRLCWVCAAAAGVGCFWSGWTTSLSWWLSGLVQLTGLDLWMQQAAPAPSIPL